MRVLIAPEVFAGPDALGLPLLEVFSLARDGRHLILTRPLFDHLGEGPVNDWLAHLPQATATAARLVLEQGIQAAVGLPAGAVGITVTGDDASDWTSARLRLADALRLLRAPLGLLLENRRSDLRFLLALAPPTQRRQLQAAIDDGWIEVQHGGGLGEMKALIEESIAQAPAKIGPRIRLLRLWVMFDRDTDPRDRSQPSAASLSMKELCERASSSAGPWPLGYWQLGRRAIENYLPEPLLRGWEQGTGGSEKTVRRRMIDALCELRKTRPAAAHQVNMKRGLLGDLDALVQRQIRKNRRDIQDSELDPIFQGLPAELRKALTQGFGKDIADLFGCLTPGYEESFRREFDRGRPADEPTREAILASLLARL